MNRRLLAALALVAAFVFGGVRAAQSWRVLLPAVANGQAAPTITTLVEDDSTFVGVALVPGTSRVLLTYIDRAHGNRLHLVEDVGDHVAEVKLPPLGTVSAAPSPSFVAPGDKQADGVPIVLPATFNTPAMLRVYFTSRDEDDPDGPFKLKRLTMPVPAETP